ncbi:response regulator [Limnoglobus roseus]|uniref:Response regulator n=1 Tax=Limnoglobus roseus TaxID=2598579 RepID=A0A5C1AKF9_9BACT|nr:response regulator [Limnoglobus roseus]QEL17644.1 response regulator [Limnoglobus roseus]
MDNKHSPRFVLVVDDHADAADSMATFLSLHGYCVRTAYGGRDALRSAAEAPPNVVLLDLLMPGMNGWGVAEQLAVTGNARDRCRHRPCRRRPPDPVGVGEHFVPLRQVSQP